MQADINRYTAHRKILVSGYGSLILSQMGLLRIVKEFGHEKMLVAVEDTEKYGRHSHSQ